VTVKGEVCIFCCRRVTW